MKSKVARGLNNIIQKTMLVSSIVVPLLFAGCKKDEPPIVKSLEQSVFLNNDVEIKYSATLSNVDKAELKINKEGVLISTEEISVASAGSVYQKTYSFTVDSKITKGKYEFILRSDNLEKKNSIEIPNYDPSINTFGINIDLIENQEINTTLQLPSDKNPEDNPVPIIGVKSLDGKTQATLKTISTGYDLDIKALSNQTGDYKLVLDYGSTKGGLGQTVLQGQIMKDTRINPFIQPNDSTLNWYGSGDLNNDNTVNLQDLTILNEIISGTYSNPGDTRLMDRADVNGDGLVNSQDAQLLQNKLNGSITYLPGEWNKLPTREEKEVWAKKMFTIDKTNTTAFLGGDCNQFSDQAYINFHGVSSTDIPIFQEVYPYDFTNNGRFNLPLEEVILEFNGSEGHPPWAHAMNVFIFGNPSIFGNLCPTEPQTDQINVPITEDFLLGINSNFYVRGLPILGIATSPDGKKIIEMTWYVKYDVKNKIPTLTWVNPVLITQIGK